MTPSMGRVVHYTVSQQDADQVNRRRTHIQVLEDARPSGTQARIGNEVRVE